MNNTNESSANVIEEAANEVLGELVPMDDKFINEKRNIFRKLINRISKFDIITDSINFTAIPDDVVLIILNANGIQCKEISELESISCDEVDEPGKYGIVLKARWPRMINPIEINCVMSYNLTEYEYHKYGGSYKEDVY